MTSFAKLHAALAIASDLHAKIETIRADAAKSGGHSLSDMEDILMAENGTERVLRRLLRLTQMAANADADVSRQSAIIVSLAANSVATSLVGD